MKFIIGKFKLLDARTNQYCCLREYFEKLDGEPKNNHIDLDFVDESKVIDIEDRPNFTPLIYVYKGKKLNETDYYIFSEKIHTNNSFLRKFEMFLKENIEEVKAEGFDDVPKTYIKGWYGTQYFTGPSTLYETRVAKREPTESGSLPKITLQKKLFRGPDKVVLGIVKAETIDERLKRIEKESDFSAMISQIDKDFAKNKEEKLEAIELKHGLFHFAIVKV